MPFRLLASWLGAQVTYDTDTQTITGTLPGHQVKLQLGSRTATVNGVVKTLPVPPISINGHSMVPLRFFAEAMGVDVHWSEKTRRVTLQWRNKQAILSIPQANASAQAAVQSALMAQSGLGAAQTGPKKLGGVYNVGVFEEPKTNNLMAALGTGATTWTLAPLLPQYAALYGNVAPRFDWAPVLAADTPSPIKEEGNLYTSVVPLRRDLVWSDGVRFSAADVVFTFSSILQIGPDKLSGNWESTVSADVLARVEAVDDHSVKFYLKKRPGLYEWQYGILQTSILAKKHWEPVFAKAFATKDPVKTLYAFDDIHPVAIGGFVGARWEKGAFYELKKDAKSVFPSETYMFHENGMEIVNSDTGFHYQSTDMGGPVTGTIKAGPLADTAVYRLFLSQNAAYLALQKGEIDYVLNPSGLAKGTQTMLANHGDIQLVQSPQNGFRYLGFNCNRYPMNNKAFRQAIATVIDSEWLAQTILQGTVEPIASVVPPGNGFWHNPNVKEWGKGLSEHERVKEAVRILKSAGFTWDKEPQVVPARGGYAVEEGEGLKGPDGRALPRLTLLAPTAAYDPLRFEYAQWVQTWVTALGIDLRAKPTDFNLISDKQNQRDYDMVIGGWSLGLYPNHLWAFFHSQSSMNRGSYRSAEYDKVADAFAAADNMEEARQWAFKAQAILAEDVPYVVLYANPIVEAYRKDKVRYEFTQVLNGIQGLYGLPSSVQVLE